MLPFTELNFDVMYLISVSLLYSMLYLKYHYFAIFTGIPLLKMVFDPMRFFSLKEINFDISPDVIKLYLYFMSVDCI
jgi:hypothetical protein